MPLALDLPTKKIKIKHNQLRLLFEAFPGQEGKFEEFMLDLEKIYSIDKLLMTEHADKMYSEIPVKITLMGGRSFEGNLGVANELINKVELKDFISSTS